MDDFFRVKGTLLRRSLSASFSVPPYMATCVAISMSVLISVFINCKETYASVLTIQYLHSISCVVLVRTYCVGSFIFDEETEREKGRERVDSAIGRLRAKKRDEVIKMAYMRRSLYEKIYHSAIKWSV